jgi:uncharacterized protein (DUF427 family)
MEKLERSATSSQCPFKGTAHYFSVSREAGGGAPGADAGALEDAAWSYEEPFDEHQALKERLAFYDDKYRNIHVRVL